MSNISETLNKYLRAIFDIDDTLYKSLISDYTGVPAGTINNPIDYNIGVIADVLEYTRNLGIDLATQIFLNIAEDSWLDYIAHEHIGLVRYDGETDTEYITRIQEFILSDKLSPASIIYATRQFSSTEPQIIEGQADSAFADVTFTDNYTMFQNQTPGDEYLYWVWPAIASGTDTLAFFYILILTDTDPGDILKLLNLVERYTASGVDYEIQIQY